MTRDTDERGKLADKIAEILGEGLMPVLNVSEFHLIVAALRAPAGHAEREAKCAACGFERSEHHHDGACYGICGKFVPALSNAPAPSEGVRELQSALTKIAAECHRAKWWFDLSDDYRPSYAAARATIKKGFDELHRIGDLAMKMRPATAPADTEDQGRGTLGYAKGER